MITFDLLYNRHFLEEDENSSANLSQDLSTFKQAVGMGGDRGNSINKNLKLHIICSSCGQLVYKSRGRYPHKCPNCKYDIRKEQPEVNESEDKETYEQFFKKALKKFGVKEPDELHGEDKKNFYSDLEKWDAENENG